jgi:hypothetical protein
MSIRGTTTPKSWDSALAAAAGQWSHLSGASWVVYYKKNGFIGPVNADMYLKSSAPPGYSGAPAVTDLKYSGSRITSGSIYFNKSFSWNLTGTLNQAGKKADVRTVAIHELGHEIYLNHPSSCGSMTSAEVAAAMNPNYKKKWTTNADDRAGAAARK